MDAKIEYHFTGKVWKHGSEGGWYFVSLPGDISKEIREHLQWQEEGWGRMKATAAIDDTIWKTAIWYDKKHETYLLPLKAVVRKQLTIDIDDEVEVSIRI